MEPENARSRPRRAGPARGARAGGASSRDALRPVQWRDSLSFTLSTASSTFSFASSANSLTLPPALSFLPSRFRSSRPVRSPAASLVRPLASSKLLPTEGSFQLLRLGSRMPVGGRSQTLSRLTSPRPDGARKDAVVEQERSEGRIELVLPADTRLV